MKIVFFLCIIGLAFGCKTTTKSSAKNTTDNSSVLEPAKGNPNAIPKNGTYTFYDSADRACSLIVSKVELNGSKLKSLLVETTDDGLSSSCIFKKGTKFQYNQCNEGRCDSLDENGKVLAMPLIIFQNEIIGLELRVSFDSGDIFTAMTYRLNAAKPVKSNVGSTVTNTSPNPNAIPKVGTFTDPNTKCTLKVTNVGVKSGKVEKVSITTGTRSGSTCPLNSGLQLEYTGCTNGRCENLSSGQKGLPLNLISATLIGLEQDFSAVVSSDPIMVTVFVSE
ncbi:MAG: hypothetical protein NT027_03775 [Proteobacteria bacterium]|nr:hypothetical protein [Pseudomonadota bacterium]